MTPTPRPKSPPIIDEAHRNWIATLPCLVCRTPLAVSPHHAKTKGSGGGDNSCVPLCHKHHTGDEGVHTLRTVPFEKRFGVDLLSEAARLFEVHNKIRGLS